MAIGDDDQSIYEWRGASPEEIIAVKGPGASVNIIEGDIPNICVNTAIGLMETGSRQEDIAVLSWSHKSLQRLIYVALTRAIESLTIVKKKVRNL